MDRLIDWIFAFGFASVLCVFAISLVWSGAQVFVGCLSVLGILAVFAHCTRLVHTVEVREGGEINVSSASGSERFALGDIGGVRIGSGPAGGTIIVTLRCGRIYSIPRSVSEPDALLRILKQLAPDAKA